MGNYKIPQLELSISEIPRPGLINPAVRRMIRVCQSELGWSMFWFQSEKLCFVPV